MISPALFFFKIAWIFGVFCSFIQILGLFVSKPVKNFIRILIGNFTESIDYIGYTDI
jgi:hypothetical protein